MERVFLSTALDKMEKGHQPPCFRVFIVHLLASDHKSPPLMEHCTNRTTLSPSSDVSSVEHCLKQITRLAEP